MSDTDTNMEPRTQQTSRMQRRSSVPATVIVVDDDQEQRTRLCANLEKTGLDARGFSSAADALEAMASGQPPALIVTDLCMPGIDGWQFCRLLRSSVYSALNQVPILVTSTTATGEEQKRIATSLGVYAHLALSFDDDAFIKQVLEILRGQITPTPPRALIVEAGKHEAALLGTVFAAEGYTAKTALTIQEAEEALEATSYDLAIIDHRLPDGSGAALLDRCRRDHPDCVCIIMSDDPSPGTAVDFMSKGAAACVRKPCEPAYLLKLCSQTRKERSLMRAAMQHEARTRELRDSQNLFRALTVSEQDAIIMMDTQGAITFWNPAAVRIFGFEPHETMGKNLHELLTSPDDYTEYRKAFPRFQENGTGDSIGTALELNARCKDGREIPIELSLSAIPLSDGWHAVGIVRDITGRKQAERALQESEKNLGSILGSIDAAVMSYSIKNNRFLYVSPSTERIYGRQLQECVNNKFAVVDNVHPDDIDILHDITTRMTNDGTADGECRILRPDGRIVWVHAHVKLIRDENGEPDRIDRMITDITERKNLEIQLQQNQTQTVSILEEIDDIVMSGSMKDNSLLYLSPSFTRLFGEDIDKYRRDAHLWAEHIHPDDYDAVYDHTVEMTAEGSSELEFRIIKPDGDIAWVRTRSKIIVDENGEPDRIQRILTDITEHKKAERDREKLQRRLLQAQKMESIARLAGGVAHDFNNMLSIIIGHADIALGRLTPGQSLHTTFSQIRRAAERSAALTRQLLAFAGRQAIAPRVLDLNNTIESMLGSLQQLIGNTVKLVWHPSSGLDPVRMDPAQVDQVLAELCQNARNAIDTTGTITIATGSASISEAQHAALHKPGIIPGDYITITVSDDGRGMDAETLATVFEPFTDAHTPGRKSGLGLATVYGIIEQNKGCITVTSEPDIGTSITIYLPRCAGAIPHTTNNDQKATTAQRKGTILLVEDEPDNLELYRTMLESLGCTVLAADTAEQCVRLAQSHKGHIDLLITDVVMPDTNGRELANEVLTLRPETQCLFMSGYSADVIAQHGILDPGINFIEKPFSLQNFTAKVKELLSPELVH